MRRSRIVITTLLALAASGAGAAGDADAGREKAAQCAQCHGADGNSQVAQFPRLAGQHAEYIVRALADYASGARRNPIMAGITKGLSAEDRENLAAYFASQDGLRTVRR